MAPRSPSPGRWVRSSLAVALALAVALLVPAAAGVVPLVVAVPVWAGLGLIAAAGLGLLQAELAALARYVEAALGREDGSGRESAPAGLFTRALAAAVERLIRDRAQGRARLEGERAALERALDALPEPLLVLSSERKIVRANRAANELLGGDGVGRDIAAALRDPALIAAIEEAIGGGESRDIEFTLQAPVERIFAARIARLPEPGADDTGVLLALVDLTSVRRTEQMRADFVANASHEMRTPLTTFVGFIETIQGSARDDAEARERFLAIMGQHAKRMARLVDDLLSLSRIEMNEHTPPTEEVRLPTLLAHVRNTLAWQAARRGVSIAVEAEERLPPIVGDGDEMTQVFLNLVDNAIKYGDAHGTVALRARRLAQAPDAAGWRAAGSGAIAVSVEDHGAGIPREHLPRLTERFYRVDKARSRELGGTGLGLAIVKHIVNRHRGVLAIDSVPGEGSTVTVYLPPVEDGPEPPPRNVA